MMRRRLFVPLLSFTFLLAAGLSLLACGGGAAEAPTSQTTEPTPTVATTESTPTATTPMASPTAEATPTESATEAPTMEATPAESPTEEPAQAGEVEVSILDFSFDPPTVTIAPGTTVVWTNVGPTAHTATSQEQLWDSGILQAGGTYSITFNEPGEYGYWCTLHPNMVGSVIVE